MKTILQIQERIKNLKETLKKLKEDEIQTSWHSKQEIILDAKISELEWVIYKNVYENESVKN